MTLIINLFISFVWRVFLFCAALYRNSLLARSTRRCRYRAVRLSVLRMWLFFIGRPGTNGTRKTKQTNPSTSDSMPHRSKEFNRNRRCNRAPSCCCNLVRWFLCRLYRHCFPQWKFVSVRACPCVATENALNISALLFCFVDVIRSRRFV